jgi:hypothetical protein
VRLRGQVFQEQGVHRPLEADVQVRDVALGERDDVDAGEGETLEETGRVFLVAAEAVQRFGEDDVTSKRRFNASRINAWNPERSNVAPEIAWSVNS